MTVTLNGCESTDQVTVFINASVNADAGEDVIICLGSSTILTATGGSSYQWNTGETTQSIEVSPEMTTTYSVEVFNAAENNSDTDEVVVFVNDIPTANAGDDVVLNEGESTLLTATGGDSYLWSRRYNI